MTPLGSYLPSIVCHQSNACIIIPKEKINPHFGHPLFMTQCLLSSSYNLLSIIHLTHCNFFSYHVKVLFGISVCMLKTWIMCTWKSKGTESQGKYVLQSEGYRLKTITALLNGCPLFCVDALFSPCHLLYQDTSGDTHSPLVFPQGTV